MSVDLDIKDFSFTGEQNVPAAVEQQVVDSNFYQQEVNEESEVRRDLLEPPVDRVGEAAKAMDRSAQERKVIEQEVREPSQQELNFKALREEVDRIKAEKESERREYQLQLEVLRANVNHQNQAQEKEPKKFLGNLADSDVPSVADIRQEWDAREASYKAKLEELEVQQRNPDYAEVIEKYAVNLAKTDPTFMEGLRGASNKALYAYQQGKREKEVQDLRAQIQQRSVPDMKAETAQRIVDNSRKPGTLSQAGGQGALSKADYFASMSDREFMEMARKNLENI